MSNSKDGGSAFPSEGGKRFIHGNEVRTTLPSSGLSVRDYFAAKAMQAMISNISRHSDADNSRIAIFAYDLADTMLKEREVK